METVESELIVFRRAIIFGEVGGSRGGGWEGELLFVLIFIAQMRYSAGRYRKDTVD